MPLNWITFTGLSTFPSADFDQMYSQLAAQTPVPVTFAGGNIINWTGLVTGFPLSSYFNYMMFGGVVAITNTTGTVAAYGGIAPNLTVYKDTAFGPVSISGAELTSSNLAVMAYDSALNSGGGGFHMVTQPANMNPMTSMSVVTFTSVLTGGALDTQTSIAGVSIGDMIVAQPATAPSIGINYQAFCAVAGTVTTRAFNYSAASITPGTITFRLAITRPRP